MDNIKAQNAEDRITVFPKTADGTPFLYDYQVKGIADLMELHFSDEEENQEALLPFMKKVKSLYPDKNVWAFTGYIYDKDLILGGRKHTKDTDDLLSLIDVLVDGPFIEEQKDITLKFRGSVNQRILDLKKTMESGKIVKLME
mgnify:CR=1 FL=1